MDLEVDLYYNRVKNNFSEKAYQKFKQGTKNVQTLVKDNTAVRVFVLFALTFFLFMLLPSFLVGSTTKAMSWKQQGELWTIIFLNAVFLLIVKSFL
jgi:hypothetical protein